MLQKIFNIAGHVLIVLFAGIIIGVGTFALVNSLFGKNSDTNPGRSVSGSEDGGAGKQPNGNAAETSTTGPASQVTSAGTIANTAVISTTFSGDTIALFGLSWEEAWKVLGDGSDSPPGRIIVNDAIGVEVSLINSEDDAETYLVRQVRLKTGAARVSFNGVKVGDTLKAADKSLMDAGADYYLGLRWIIDIAGATYEIKCNTSNDKTISGMQIREIDRIEEVGLPGDAEDEDPHDFEPQYWE